MSRSGDIGTKTAESVVRVMRANGWPDAERSALHGAKDRGDLTGIGQVCVEVKGGHAAEQASDGQVAAWMAELDTECVHKGADVGVLVMKRKGVGHGNADRWWAGDVAARHRCHCWHPASRRGPHLARRADPRPHDPRRRLPGAARTRLLDHEGDDDVSNLRMGLSAQAIAGSGHHHPWDPADLLRCVNYCRSASIATTDLRRRMAGRSIEWDRLLPEWDNLTALLDHEMRTRTDGLAPRTYVEMKRVIHAGTACAACDATGRGAECPKCKGSGRRSGGRCRAPGCHSGAAFCADCRGRGYTKQAKGTND